MPVPPTTLHQSLSYFNLLTLFIDFSREPAMLFSAYWSLTFSVLIASNQPPSSYTLTNLLGASYSLISHPLVGLGKLDNLSLMLFTLHFSNPLRPQTPRQPPDSRRCHSRTCPSSLFAEPNPQFRHLTAITI